MLDVVDEGLSERNLKGKAKIKLISSVLKGSVDQVQGTLSLSGGAKSQWHCVRELYPLIGDQSEPDIEELTRRAKAKGESSAQKKWFYGIWENEREFEKNPEKPDKRIGLLSLTKVSLNSNEGEYLVDFTEMIDDDEDDLRNRQMKLRAVDKDAEVKSDI